MGEVVEQMMVKEREHRLSMEEAFEQVTHILRP